jgi:hypothetical protein
MPRNSINVRPVAMPRGVLYCIGCKWSGGGGISWFDPENHRPTGHNLKGTQGILFSTEPIVKSCTMSFTNLQVTENYGTFFPARIDVDFEWVDKDGAVICDAGGYGQGGASQQPGIGWFLQNQSTGHYSVNSTVVAETPNIIIIGPLNELDGVLLNQAAGIKQTVTLTPGSCDLSADVGLTSATIWLGATR